MKRYLIATIKSWNIENYKKLVQQFSDCEFKLVDKKEDFSLSLVEAFDPDYVFFPHWSWIIPDEIYTKYICVVFHSTDLPFGRGGSPLQNLIVRGIYDTKISALKVCEGVDAGPVYFKEPVDISEGNVDEIFKRISDIIFFKMIPRFILDKPEPVEQSGEVISFKRRKPEDSEIPEDLSERELYDFIRMLDGEGYPPAFINYNDGKIVFKDAEFTEDGVMARAIFMKEKKEN